MYFSNVFSLGMLIIKCLYKFEGYNIEYYNNKDYKDDLKEMIINIKN